MEERQPKWLERLGIFNNAIARLAEVIEIRKQRSLNQFECDSLIKRFEFSYEMAWKLMMSFEKENGIEGILGSKDVVRHAKAMQIIENGEAWMDMIDARNTTSHVYDEQMAMNVADDIINTYFPLLQELNIRMQTICTD